jgi:hypothetical protein
MEVDIMISRFGKFISVWATVCLLLVACLFIMPDAMALGSGDEITASGCNYPSTLAEGKSFALKGVVTSESSKIVRLEAGVYNSHGDMLTGRSWNPNSKSIDFRWYVNPYVEFGKLTAGTYTYKITATNGSVKKTLLSQTFEVTPRAKEPDNLSASGCNAPASLTKGKGFALRGTVLSQSSKITNLTAGVFDTNGDMVTGRSFNPKAKSVDIKWKVNPYVKFGKLDVGDYTYKIIATNGEGQKTLFSQDFEVVAPDPVSDELSASNLNHPTSIVKGKGFSLRGVVFSQSSKISNLTAGVFDENGDMLTGRSFNPKAKSVDLRWYVNPYVKFGDLVEGTYTYEVTATNAAGQETLLSESFQVTPADPVSDKLTSSGLNAPTLLIKGRGFAVRGVVFSQNSKISQLTAGVFDANGTMLTGRSWNPKAKSVDFRWYVNEHIKFGTLEIGTYTYKVVATNDAGTSTLLEASFEVVE